MPIVVSGRLLVDPAAPPRRGWLRVDDGRIAEIGDGSPPVAAPLGGDDAIVCPGFVDAHLHLPQMDEVGCVVPDLLAWLDAAIYPAERRWADPEHAARHAERGLVRLLAAGTTGIAAFLSPHAHASAAAATALARVPLRAVVGQAIMATNGPPDLLEPPTPTLPAEHARLAFSLNPRFAITCGETLLAALGDRARAERRIVHTHLAEQRPECAAVRTLFPDAPHYAGVYDRAGLLGPRTLLAHAIHLSEPEWALLAARGCTVVHCPGANLFLDSGLFDLRAAQRHRVPVALGSDVAAGPDLAMPRVARAMLDVAAARRTALDPAAPRPTPADAWSIVTRGNAAALGWRDHGRLAIGDAADLLVLRCGLDPNDPHLLGRLVYGWREEWIETVVLAGAPLRGAALRAGDLDAAARPR